MTEVIAVADQELDAGDLRASGATGRIGRGLAGNSGGLGVTLIIQHLSVSGLLAALGVATDGEWLRSAVSRVRGAA